MIAGYGGLTKPKPGVQIDPLHPLSKGLVGCWLFNEGSGSRAADISEHGNHGTLTNMSPNAQGSGWGGSKSGGGVQFDGSDDYVEMADYTFQNGDSFTLSALFKLNAYQTGSYECVAGQHNEFQLNVRNDRFQWFVRNTATYKELNYFTAVALNTWYYLVGTRDIDGTIKLYLNATEVATDTISGELLNVSDKFLVGDTYSNVYPFNGIVDSVRIYTRALSATEVKQLYHDPFCNLSIHRRWYVPSAGPSGVIMNQFQGCNIGADLFNGALQ